MLRLHEEEPFIGGPYQRVVDWLGGLAMKDLKGLGCR
jgi:hypothetical protein